MASSNVLTYFTCTRTKKGTLLHYAVLVPGTVQIIVEDDNTNVPAWWWPVAMSTRKRQYPVLPTGISCTGIQR